MKVAMLARLTHLVCLLTAFHSAKPHGRLLQVSSPSAASGQQSVAAYYTASPAQAQAVFAATPTQQQTVYATAATLANGQPQLVYASSPGSQQQVVYATAGQPQTVFAAGNGQPQMIYTSGLPNGQSPAILSSYKGNYVQGLDQVNTIFTNPALSSTTGTNYYYDPTTKMLINTKGQSGGAISTGNAGKINNNPTIIPQGSGAAAGPGALSGAGFPSTIAAGRASTTGVAGGSMAGNGGMVSLNPSQMFVSAIPARPTEVSNSLVEIAGRVYMPGNNMSATGNWVSGYPMSWSSTGQSYVIPVLFSGYWTTEMNDPQYWVARGYPASTWISSGTASPTSPNYRSNPFATVGRINFEAGNPPQQNPIPMTIPRPTPTGPIITNFPTMTTTKTTTTVIPSTNTVTTIPQTPNQQIIYIPVSPATNNVPATSTSTIDWTSLYTTTGTSPQTPTNTIVYPPATNNPIIYPSTSTTTTATSTTQLIPTSSTTNTIVYPPTTNQVTPPITTNPPTPPATTTTPMTSSAWSAYLSGIDLSKLTNEQLLQLLNMQSGMTSSSTTVTSTKIDPVLVNAVLARIPPTVMTQLLTTYPTLTSYQIAEIVSQSPPALSEILSLSASPYYYTTAGGSNGSSTTTTTTTITSTPTTITSTPGASSTFNQFTVTPQGSMAGSNSVASGGLSSASTSGSSSVSTTTGGSSTVTDLTASTVPGSLSAAELAQYLLTPQTSLSYPNGTQMISTTQPPGSQSSNSTTTASQTTSPYPNINTVG